MSVVFQNQATNWFYESAATRLPGTVDDTPISSFGAVHPDGDGDSFDQRFKEISTHYKESGVMDIQKDFHQMIADPGFMNTYKEDLLNPVIEAFEKMSPGDPHIRSIVENVNRYWDNKVKSYTESANILGMLPISSLEFPVLVKQFFSSILKDIIDVESVKTPDITKHIRTTYMVDNQTGDEYEYPKCMFDGTWEKLYYASRGHVIDNTIAVPLANGRVWKYDIIGGLTDGTPGKDHLSMALYINAIQVGSERIELPGNGITIEFSTNSTLVNGDLNFTAPSGTVVEDNLGGQVDFKNGTISASCMNGQITGFYLKGFLSNEDNMRSISVRERRSLLKIHISDGPRWVMPFSIEEIEEASAMLDVNYYNRMVDEITRTQEMNECMDAIRFLLDEQKRFNGITTDTFNLESLALTQTCHLKAPAGFAGDPFKYMSSIIQFTLKGMIHRMLDDTKLDDLSFVVVGNPMATQLMAPFSEWKCQQGTSIGGISVNGSYGFATDMGANVRVVASNLYDAYTVNEVEETHARELVLHIYAYPTSQDHISFKHLKFTNHLMTSQSQTAYSSPNAPGGAYNIVTATSRFENFAVQGIQADLIMLDSFMVYGQAPSRPPVKGAPWAA